MIYNLMLGVGQNNVTYRLLLWNAMSYSTVGPRSRRVEVYALGLGAFESVMS